MAGTWHGGKGDKARKVDQAKFSANWDVIFGKKDMKFTTAEEYMNEEIEGDTPPESENERQARLRIHNQ